MNRVLYVVGQLDQQGSLQGLAEDLGKAKLIPARRLQGNSGNVAGGRVCIVDSTRTNSYSTRKFNIIDI